ncbi:MAG TPA: phosphoribosylanthranilate isomerase [Ferrovibrio sp.]|jgi:phosphoribosylanthranilate isomerase|uniref:phosphoribosylanthranilate isomerase n=1 Tax=Ferrovibrio sp. TaxID=1917215 RepID=UPI002B4AB00A|nr:phosphoribosylanthranilate isomerase [Ferrovibrio sp.]HLT76968.1 phosphoribosylanthranilate isomerase [Ferrovibrio sp.]
MAIFTKICGINDPVAMQTAVENGADMIGLIFYPPSPRNVTAEQAEELLRDLPSGIDRVGVFVNPETDFLDRILAKARLDLMQLHGDETPDRCRALSIYFGLPVIKAFKVSEKADLKAARDYEDIVDWLMFDAKPPKDAKLPGGNAVSFDWSIMQNAKFQRPWMLSGGLTPENLPEAVKRSGATAVDVSSGVESAPGRKDPEKIRAFLKAARAL